MTAAPISGHIDTGASVEHGRLPCRLGVVVPCYNEEEVLGETVHRLTGLLERMINAGLVSSESAIYLVDDGSRDRTWELIRGFARDRASVHGIKLAHNVGHQNAVIAGMFAAEGDAVVTIDADLQDDVEAIARMVEHFGGGAEIIYGVRSSRAKDSWFKRNSAEGYYRLLAAFGVKVVFNHADYRLMSRKALDALRHYSEVNLFLRGIVPLLGYRTETVYYERAERFAGESKYPLRKMLALAVDGITSFSVTPLRLISLLGFVTFGGSLAMTFWVLFGKLVEGTTIPGWASSVLPVYFLGGVQLLSLGVIGEYVAKIYMESKRRPRYAIEQVI